MTMIPGSMSRVVLSSFVGLVIAIFLAIFPQSAQSQSLIPGLTSGAEVKDPTQLDELIGKAREEGSTIVVISPKAEDAGAKADSMAMMRSEELLRNREKMRELFTHIPEIIPEIRRVIIEASIDGSPWWFIRGVLTAVAGLAAGLFLYKRITGFLVEYFRETRENPNPTRAQTLAMLLTRATLLFLSSVLMFGVAIIIALIFDPGYEPTRRTIFQIVVGYAAYRVLRYVIFLNIFVPDISKMRLINLNDARARLIYTDWYRVTAVAVVLISIVEWLRGLGVDREVYVLLFIFVSALIAVTLEVLTFRHREDLLTIVRGHSKGRLRQILTVVSRILLPVILIYLAVAWVVSSVRLAVGLPGAYLPLAAPIIVYIAGMFAYGFASYILELIYEYRAARFRRDRVLRNLRESRAARRRAAIENLPAAAMEDDDMAGMVNGDMPDHEEMIVHQQRPEDSQPSEYKPMFKRFWQNAIASLILVVCIGELGRLWGLELGREGGHPFSNFLDAALAGLVAFFLIQSFNAFIDDKIIEEGGSLDDTPANPGESDSEGGTGESRLATLLPIIRRGVVFTLAVIAGTIGLSAMGVNVAPLFAGAGVVGIAVGFGAQTLIRDIFSGLFFLIDDAFRKGEYIEVGTVKGVIEKISVRSFQLRHHLGAVHTVPFGEITQLTNYSRDWVMMKLPLRLTYDTDVEKVRKLVKKLGQRLLEDQVVGPLFLQPLKSQGVYKMEDSAMIIRVKFMTRPGDQFVTRKVVYAAIRELFEQEGIKFAHREVTVRLADGKNPDNLTEEEKEAIAGSVRSAIDAEEEAAKATAGSDR